jgi:hypothetical protein
MSKSGIRYMDVPFFFGSVLAGKKANSLAALSRDATASLRKSIEDAKKALASGSGKFRARGGDFPTERENRTTSIFSGASQRGEIENGKIKAIAAGADMVMIGGMFAGTDEAPGELVGGKKVYRGMASRDAMRVIRVGDSMPTPEGTSVLVDSKGPVGQIVQDIAGGLRSAFSYSNSRNIKDFQKRAQFGIKRR